MKSAVLMAMQLHHQFPNCTPAEVLMKTLKLWQVTVYSRRYRNGVSGFMDSYRGCYTIVVNESEPKARRLFTLAHELGHIIAGHECKSDSRAKQELWANRFAAALLMPAGRVRTILDQGGTAADIAAAFCVSPEAAMNRIREIRACP